MDRFVTVKSRNKNLNHHAFFFKNEKIVEDIRLSVENGEVMCIWGDCGVGKTFIVDHVTKNKNKIELDSEYVRSKNSMIEMIEKLKKSFTHVIIDDFEIENIGFKEIMDRVNEGEKITNGSLIFISSSSRKFEKIKCFEIQNLNVNELVRLGQQKFPKKNVQDIVESAKKSRGNIRDFFSYIDNSDFKDIFKTPKSFVYDLVCSDVRWPENPMNHLCTPIDEHGYTWGVIHENYLDSPLVNDSYSDIADWMSQADVLDTLMYNGNWEISKLFTHYAIIMPAIKLQNSLKKNEMRPGSSWTKYNNFKMRSYKLKSMSCRKLPIKFTFDHIYILHNYCHYDQEQAIKIFLAYRLDSSDLDVINHICFTNKLKPRILNKLKKDLKNEYKSK